MKKFLLAAFSHLLFHSQLNQKVPYTHQSFKSTDETQVAVHFVSVEDIKKKV